MNNADLIRRSTVGAGPKDKQEQTRACFPDTEGFVERDGEQIFYEV